MLLYSSDMALWLPETAKNDRVVPDWFLRLLKDVDPALCVFYNRFHDRWMIQRKAEDNTQHHVLTVEGDNGEYMSLNERTIAKLKEMDTWSKYGSAENFHLSNENTLAEDEAKRQAKIDDVYTHSAQINRRQLHEAHSLIQTHDMSEIH